MLSGRLAVALTTAFVTFALPLYAEAKLAMEIVYDASGSMWAKVGEKERFVVLNKALEAFLQKIPQDVVLALRVYGAKSKGDCADTELVVPFGTGNREAIRDAIRKIKPLGKTPIQRSLLAAAEDLKSQEDSTKVIVLVSDGKETCDGDPCETARKLAETEKIQIDVVGFAITSEETRRQLNCIATVGAGNYFEAASEQDLNTGLDTAARTSAPPPAPPKTGRIQVRAERPRGVQAPTRGLAIDIFAIGSPDVPAASYEGQNLVSAELPVGSYRVRVRLGDVEGIIDNVNLEENTVQKVVAEFPPLEGVVIVAGMSGSNPLGTRVVCTAYPAGQGGGTPVAEQYGSLPMTLPEGNYDLRCVLTGTAVSVEEWLRNVAVQPGQTRQLQASFPMGTLLVAAAGPPSVLGNRQTYGVFPAGEHQTRLTWNYAGSASEVPAGTYDVQVEVGEGFERRMQWLEGVQVRQGSTTEVAADFRPGEILLQVTTGGQSVGNDAKFTVYPPGSDLKTAKALGWSYSGVPLSVPAGTYDALVEFQPSGGQLQKQWVAGLAVPPGQQLAREIEFATGQLLIHVLAGGQDLGREGGYSIYLPGEHDRALGKYDNHAAVTIPTGSYDVKSESYYHQYSEWRRDVTVTKDRATELTVDFPTGKLVVQVLQGGEDLGTGATYYVYPQGEKNRHIAFAFSGKPLELVPGNYDVKTTVGLTLKWEKGVFVEAGETTETKIEF